jgi:nucleotide-binding universal stress UspA family protein
LKEIIVYKHLLLPTDGSELSQAAILEGVCLAKESGAKVTGVSVVPEFHMLTFNTTMIEDTKAVFIAESRAQAEKNLAILQKAADEAGVPCSTEVAVNDHAFEAIIRIADAKGCDLIVMASHGRRGARALLLGSETQKVLTHTAIPVLVHRKAGA